jgi:formyl-CoA transferase
VGAILASIIARDRTGRGDRVDIPMFETMVAFVLGDHMGGLTYEPPLDGGGYARQLSPERRPYRTKDGYICALVYNDKQWEGFLKAIGRESLVKEDERFATFANRSRNIDHVYGWVSQVFEGRTTAEWMRLLEEADVPFMPMHDLQSVLKDPHLEATGFFKSVQHPTEGAIKSMRMPMTWANNTADEPRPAPRLGEHTVEVLREAGFAQNDIDSLLSTGAAKQGGAG